MDGPPEGPPEIKLQSRHGTVIFPTWKKARMIAMQVHTEVENKTTQLLKFNVDNYWDIQLLLL